MKRLLLQVKRPWREMATIACICTILAISVSSQREAIDNSPPDLGNAAGEDLILQPKIRQSTAGMPKTPVPPLDQHQPEHSPVKSIFEPSWTWSLETLDAGSVWNAWKTYAVTQGNSSYAIDELVSFLLERPAIARDRDSAGHSVLHLAAIDANLPVMQALLKSSLFDSFDQDFKGYSAWKLCGDSYANGVMETCVLLNTVNSISLSTARAVIDVQMAMAFKCGDMDLRKDTLRAIIQNEPAFFFSMKARLKQGNSLDEVKLASELRQQVSCTQ